MWIWTALNWLVKPLGWITEYLGKKVDANVEHHRIDSTVEIASIEADVEINKLKKDLLIAYQGWWATRWIVPGFAWPLILWFNMIVLDSVFKDFWPFTEFDIAKLPQPLQGWAGQIILSFFIVKSIENIFSPVRNSLGEVVGGIVDRITGRVKTNFTGGGRRGKTK